MNLKKFYISLLFVFFAFSIIRLEMISKGDVMDDDSRALLSETYKHYSEVFNREAKQICNAQGIY